MGPSMTWPVAFGLTLLVEAPLYLFATRGQNLRPLTRLAAAVGTSALTHPFVWFVFPPLLIPVAGWLAYFVVAETFAVVVEALYLRALRIERPWAISLGANATSASIGLLLTYLA